MNSLPRPKGWGEPFMLFHHAFDSQTNHLVDGVGADCNSLLEVTRELVCAVIGDVNDAFLTWLDGLFRVGGNGATATGKSLMDDEWGCACVGEGE